MKEELKERLIKKIVMILADYKFNSTATETAEMTAERIIGIVKQQQNKDIVEIIENCKIHTAGNLILIEKAELIKELEKK